MRIDTRLLAYIARHHPEIYDGPHFGGPVTRGELVSLNPQPLPPLEVGRAAAAYVLTAAWTAQSLGTSLTVDADWEGDWCGTYPSRPRIPWPWPVPEPEPHPDWVTGYHLGFASVLADAVERGVIQSSVVDGLLKASMANLDAGLRG